MSLQPPKACIVSQTPTCTYQLTLPRLELAAKRGVRKHSSGTTLGIAVPTRLPGTSFLEMRDKRHDGNTLGSRRRVERINLGLQRYFLHPIRLSRRRTKGNGGGKNAVIDRFAFGRRRLLLRFGGSSWKVDSLFDPTNETLEGGTMTVSTEKLEKRQFQKSAFSFIRTFQ